MIVSELIADLETLALQGSQHVDITGIAFDSRRVEAGMLFVALRGSGTDGHLFIPQALEAGAVAIVSEEAALANTTDCTFIRVENARKALALMASTWYGHPSRELYLVGITGTNGKTTIASLLHEVHGRLGYPAGLLSTIEVKVGDKSLPASHTTPDPLQIHAHLRSMVDLGCGFCFMEVSSHAIDQDRTTGLDFNGGIFTNLSRDHLDYHKDFKSYLQVKKRFFDELPESAFALVNMDDRNGSVMWQNCAARRFSYSIRSMADFRGRLVELHLDGTSLEINGSELWVKLPGRFNASNMVAVYGAGVLSGHSSDEMLTVLSQVDAVRGRFESFCSGSGVTALVDYAHTPDALSKVLETLAEVSLESTGVITVVGAGGNRDKGKRPQMARIAAEASHKLILTSDNPRDEDPELILDEMMAGVPSALLDRVLRISDRKEAIRTACMMAQKGDIVLVAGKGHENYQVIGKKKLPFDDMQILKDNLN